MPGSTVEAGEREVPGDEAPAGGRRRRPLPPRIAVPLGISALLIVAFVAYAVHLASGGTGSGGSFPPASTPALGVGSRAPGFSLPALSGSSRVSLSALGARPVIINFFASWCPECKAELSAFAAASKRAGRAVAFVGIDTLDHAPQTARRLLQAAGDRYPVASDPPGSVATRYLVSVGLPVTYFLDGSHRVVGESLGRQTTASLERWIEKLAPAGRRRG